MLIFALVFVVIVLIVGLALMARVHPAPELHKD